MKSLFMLNVKIITLGKLKESYWSDAENEYFKRIKPYARIEMRELSEEAFRDGDDREKIKMKEAEKIKKNLPENGFVIALHEHGKEFDSPLFAKFLENNSSRGETLVFIIGGPLGLHKSILDLADIQISLSQLTFPHQMVRTILLEQLYRAITISNKKQYHY